jgi:hypothetical protein
MIRDWAGNAAWWQYKLRTLKHYWSARKIWQFLWFHFRRVLFGFILKAHAVGKSAAILSKIVALVALDCFLAILLAVGIGFADHLLRTRTITYLSHRPGHLFHVSAKALITVHLDQASIQTLLSTEATIVSLFTSLYFTSLCVIASTVYSRVPGDVRALAVGEKVGNVYIRLVVFLGAFSVIQLVATGFGYRVGPFALLIVGIISILAMFAFLTLGTRLFNFFDPGALVGYICAEIVRRLNGVSTNRGIFRDDTFQNHYRKLVAGNLATLRSITALASKEEYHKLNSQTILMLFLGTLGLQQSYARRKALIPGNSYWFERIPRFQDWLRTSHSQLELALRTGTAPRPDLLPNYLWFEEKLDEMLGLCSNTLITRTPPIGWTALPEPFIQLLQELGAKFLVADGLALCFTTKEQVKSQLKLYESTSERRDKAGYTFYLLATDFLFRYPTALLVGMGSRMRALDEKFVEEVSDNLFRKHFTGSPNRFLSRAAVTEIEDIRTKLQAERIVEGRLITPKWYVQQLISRRLILDLQELISLLITELKEVLAEVDIWSEKSSALLLGQALSSGREACEKFKAHLGFAEGWVTKLDTFKKVADESWPSVTWTELKNSVVAIQKHLTLSVAENFQGLLESGQGRQGPDFFGQAYAIVAREAFEAMTNGDVSYFEHLFPNFFTGALLTFEDLRKAAVFGGDKSVPPLLADPITDLAAISGYAKLFSELDNRAFWPIVESTWTHYLEKHPDPHGVVNTVVRLLKHKERSYITTPRSLESISWDQAFARILRERGLLSDYSGFDPEPVDRHPSPYIRAVAAGRGMDSNPGGGLFVAIFLKPRMTDLTIALPFEAESYLERLGRSEVSVHENSAEENEE